MTNDKCLYGHLAITGEDQSAVRKARDVGRYIDKVGGKGLGKNLLNGSKGSRGIVVRMRLLNRNTRHDLAVRPGELQRLLALIIREGCPAIGNVLDRESVTRLKAGDCAGPVWGPERYQPATTISEVKTIVVVLSDIEGKGRDIDDIGIIGTHSYPLLVYRGILS